MEQKKNDSTQMKNFTTKVLDRFTKEITDQVFLFIQNDKELLRDYLHLLNDVKLNSVNSNIAKAVKGRYGLTNLESKGTPKSLLILDYEEFE